jgi:hypothetical protein
MNTRKDVLSNALQLACDGYADSSSMIGTDLTRRVFKGILDKSRNYKTSENSLKKPVGLNRCPFYSIFKDFQKLPDFLIIRQNMAIRAKNGLGQVHAS